MKASELVEKAWAATKVPVQYKLGASSFSPGGKLDCSGLVCALLSIPRQTDHPLYLRQSGGWVNTDAVIADIRSQFGFFMECGMEVGAVVVIPGKYKVTVGPDGKKVRKRTKPGHIGIVTQVHAWSYSVVHCSPRNVKLHGNAIAETDGFPVFGKNAVFGWHASLEPDLEPVTTE